MMDRASTFRRLSTTARGLALAGIIAGAPFLGCVPMEEQVPDRGDIFAPLHRADLAGFEHKLIQDDHAGRDDAWTDVGFAFLDLATCRELPDEAPARLEDNPEAHLVYELVRLEDERRLRLIRQARELDRRQWHVGTVHTRFTSRDFFDRSGESVDDELIRWPDVRDKWPDEWPARTSVGFDCEELVVRDRPDTLPSPFDELEPEELTGHLITEWLQTQRVRGSIEAVDDAALADRARATVAAHRADLALLLAGRDDARDVAGPTVDHTVKRTLDELIAVADEIDLDGDYHLDIALRTARLAIIVDDSDTAIDALVQLTDHPDPTIADTARYHATKIAWMEGRFGLAADIGSEMIDGPPSVRSAYAYFAATAHRHDGREDSFLGLARDALRDRRRHPDDPFLGALYREVLRELARYEVDERTEELLEEFGPRAGLATRQREFAEVALDVGRPTVARQLVEPLLEDVDDARRLPRLHAILALAAFMHDEPSEFDTHVDELIDRPDGLREAIPRNRRAAFFAHRDTELARVLRATLPLMAEWGDHDEARARRQAWLESIVDHTQTFLRRAPESAVSDELSELYRLAGQLLDDHPRGYAERIGTEEPSASALVLGTVDMPPTPPLDEAPEPTLRWPAISSLLLIPRGGVPPDDYTTDIGRDDTGEESS